MRNRRARTIVVLALILIAMLLMLTASGLA
jgi:hypothetical protein